MTTVTLVPRPDKAVLLASWLDGWPCGRRARRYAAILLAVQLGAALLLLAGTQGGLDAWGRPLGTDFLSFYTASGLALGGHAADAYRPALHQLAEQALFPGPGYAAFFYPPPFLLLCLPLAALPYLPALAVWLAATGAGYAATLRIWLGAAPAGGEATRLPPWLLPAFPAVLVNALNGQNGFLTAALFGSGFALLARQPWLGGALLGGLVIKPHLALAIPVALAFAGLWRALVAAALSALILAVLSALVLGPAAWESFAQVAPLARATLEQGWVEPGKMVSLFAALRGAGLPLGACYAAQGLLALGALAGLACLARTKPDAFALGAGAAAATLLVSPFLLDYDLTLLAIPLVWMAPRLAQGPLPGERIVLALAFVLPLAGRPLALAGLPVAPAILLAVAGVVLRRGWPRLKPWSQRVGTGLSPR